MDTEIQEMEGLVEEVRAANDELMKDGTAALNELYEQFRAIDLEFAKLPQRVEQLQV